MEKNSFEQIVKNIVDFNAGNFVPKEKALRPDLEGMRIFGEPVFGYASAVDPLFLELKKPGIIGEHFMQPRKWLDEAQTVISVFLPFTDAVKKANAANMDWPADEWLHARVEGQAFQILLCRSMVELLIKDTYMSLVPILDSKFLGRHPQNEDRSSQEFYTSNWSERHVAYVCGLGTFGLSKGLITAQGMAGRFLSIITTAPFEPSPRWYERYDEHCTRCGACARNCPSKAISMETGKHFPTCSAFLERVTEKCKPYYGCGKCQVKVPCESRIPAK